LTTAQSLRMIPDQRPNPSYTMGMRSGVRPRKSITAFSLYLDFGGWKWFDIFFKFQVSGRLCRFFSGYLLLLTPRHWWPKILVWGCLYVFREQYNVLQKAVRALITFSQTPQLEELAALAPRTPYPALGPAFYRRRSNVLCHRKSLCLSVVCHLWRCCTLTGLNFSAIFCII